MTFGEFIDGLMQFLVYTDKDGAIAVMLGAECDPAHGWERGTFRP